MKSYTYSLLATFLVAVVGCSLGPSVVRGQVVMRAATESHINLGSADGVQVGDTLVVFRSEPNAPGVRNVRVGTLRVVKFLDTHYSAVEVLTGTLYERDIVEKRTR